MISGPVMIQVLEGEDAIAKNRDLMGATDPKKADARHDPRRLRRQHRRQRGARLRRRRNRRGRDRVLLPRHERLLQPLSRRSPIAMTANLLEFDLRGRWRRSASSWARSASARPSCSAGSTSAASATSTAMTRPREVAARQARPARAEVAALPVAQRAGRPPTARSSGCSTSAPATPSRPSSSPRTTAARCASRRRPAAPSAAASAPPATRASAATSPPARSSPSSGSPSTSLRARLDLREGERVDHQRRDDGHGRAAAELRARWCRRCARCSTTTATACRAGA